MPQFFFNLRHKPGPDDLAVDPEGDDLADIPEARDYALRAARDLIARTRSHSVRDWFVCSFEIVDVEGHPILTVPFSDTVSEQEDDED